MRPWELENPTTEIRIETKNDIISLFQSWENGTKDTILSYPCLPKRRNELRGRICAEAVRIQKELEVETGRRVPVAEINHDLADLCKAEKIIRRCEEGFIR